MDTRVKEFRKEKGLTQTELSKESGVARRIICELETGQRKVVTSETMSRISKALGKPVRDVFLL